MSDGDKIKRVVFPETTARHAQLKVRLDYDGLSQSDFFKSLITGYLNKNKYIISFIEEYKTINKTQSKRNLKYTEKDNEAAQNSLNKFGLNDNELEDIFDLIAEEHPDL